MRRKLITISTLILFVAGFSVIPVACKKEQSTRGLEKLALEIPDSFPDPAYAFTDNPLSKEGFELGRRLFYDPQLSADGLVPCSSCHQQIAGFGTFEHDRSHGVFNSHTLRNAPVLFNLAWNTSFHWDGEFTSLADEAAHPLTGSNEMGQTYQRIIDYLEADRTYRDAFKEVFRYPFIRPEFINKALAQFTGSIVSANSKFDKYKKGTVNFSAQEESGYQLYKVNCASCHPEPLFTDYSYRNIGLRIDPLLNDYGRLRVTGKAEDSLKFKVPTLRNTYISSNYMHDGRFNTLLQCLNHYRNNVQQGTTLDPLLVNGISLSDTQTDNLLLFLRALTDSSLLRDPRFTKPD
ncbi:MAG TPA: cytochrome c peroxidase [Chitinophagaceae bacterium]|nr:cytochrome c peroxidase [Chitinophagaceae bacterium]HPH31777.1 cytochrome c peroxidase [Chitinophagaceae bacterium]HPN58846.1 cytochrome c peroxidase [Chitinophagaceae bacterium]